MSRVFWAEGAESALMAAEMNTDNHRRPPVEPGITDWEKVACVLAPLFVGKKAPTAVQCSKRATTVRRRLRTGMTVHRELEKRNKLAGKGTVHKEREKANKLAGKGTKHQKGEKAKKAKWFCVHGDERAACEIDGCRAPPGANRTASRGGKHQNYVNTLQGRGKTLDLRLQQLEPEMLPLLSYAYVAGEPLTPDLLTIWGKTKIICNGYGCSETPMSVTRVNNLLQPLNNLLIHINTLLTPLKHPI
jgi:hypothetical protein